MSDHDFDNQPDPNTYLRYFDSTNLLREQISRDIIAALDLPAGSNGLDVACGEGTQALRLADAIGPQGTVTCLDINPEFLERAAAVATTNGMSGRISFLEADVAEQLPFEDSAFDWVWSSDFLGYRPLPAEVMRVIKPGGSLNIAFWSSDQLLPGYPLLESTLKATSGGLAPFAVGDEPVTHPLRALTRLRAAGLTKIDVRTYAASVYGPLNPETKRAMTDILEMRWPEVTSELSEEYADLYRRLTDPSSPEFILDLPDYYGFFIYSVFQGWVPKA